MSQDELQSAARQIAEALDETDEQPRRQIDEIIRYCGLEFVQTILKETLEVEARGGLMLADRSRRRTIGGVFFYLARNKMPHENAQRIFPNYFRSKMAVSRPVMPPPIRPFDWNERMDILNPLLLKKGDLSTVKVTLIGRPGQIDNSHKDVVITTMTHAQKSPTLPRGVPSPPEKPTLYTVYIAAKQWRKVEEAIANPDDKLIIEGTCAFDEQIGGMAVFSMNVTTKMMEAQKRQKQKAGSVEGQSQPSAVSPVKEPQSSDTASEADATLSDVPKDTDKKLRELYASASLLRQKIASIQAKPEDKQFGLEMTQKLLKNVEDEIAVLENKSNR